MIQGHRNEPLWNRKCKIKRLTRQQEIVIKIKPREINEISQATFQHSLNVYIKGNNIYYCIRAT